MLLTFSLHGEVLIIIFGQWSITLIFGQFPLLLVNFISEKKQNCNPFVQYYCTRGLQFFWSESGSMCKRFYCWLYATASCFRNKIWNIITSCSSKLYPLNCPVMLSSVNASAAHKAKYAERSDVAFLWLGLSFDPPVALVIPQRRPITPDLMKSMAHVCPFYAGIPPLFSVLFLPPCFVFSAAETINLQQSAEYLYLLTLPHFTSSVNQASKSKGLILVC